MKPHCEYYVTKRRQVSARDCNITNIKLSSAPSGHITNLLTPMDTNLTFLLFLKINLMVEQQARVAEDFER